ncbi:unnamed protein product [Rotaria socialis]|uniref:Sacsin/Nov domain-containing protein n=1 Tax=Rotaria socialis TaxID=392032 RepID=A0A820Z7V0_9BILA|nr:unnamed protein product [Rotaria socialis]CAF3460634.1 unnamed protein product [Rotaria socialis]CAF3551178.1 unnamed protein product [Rotaria socialis]CAF4097540.1 unnamed protein product [Rotaria socialis]CAF4347987.1 unnamed protein product [Rotaria socialis]
MIRKFRKIFRTPSSVTANKNENSHKATTADSNPCDTSHVKQGSSAVSNHVHKESPKTDPISSTDDVQYAKMRIISSPVFQLRDIIRALLTSSSPPPSCDLISTFLTYGQLLGAKSIHGYLVDRCYDTRTLINDEFSSYQGVALCVTYDVKLSEQQWEDIFGIHESTSTISKTATSFFHLTDFLCILSGSRVVYYDPNERMINDERAYVSIFDLEHDDIEVFQDQFSPLDYFLLKSKTFYNGTLIRLPLRTTSTTQISTHIQTLDDIKQQLFKYFNFNHSLIELLLMQTNLNTIEFDYTTDFQSFTRFLSIEKHSLAAIYDTQSTTQIIQLTLSKLINDISSSDGSRWLLSLQNDYNEIDKNKIEIKLLLPLLPLCSSSDSYLPLLRSSSYKSIQITSTRILYYHALPSSINSLSNVDICIQLRQIKFPKAYALFLKDLSRLINPTTSPSNFSIDFIWELMPDIDELQRLFNENQKYSTQQKQNIQLINNIIPDIWEEIGKQELFYSVTEGWGYVAIEDMIINNVEPSPMQDVLTYVFSEANAPIVILPPHVINGLCKYSNKHYLKVMTPFHASKLLSENSSILFNLKSEQRLLLLKYIILNDPDPNLVLELELLPLANNKFITFQNKQASAVYIVDNNADFLQLFHIQQHDRFLNPDIDQNLFEKLSSKSFQGKETVFWFI